MIKVPDIARSVESPSWWELSAFQSATYARELPTVTLQRVSEPDDFIHEYTIHAVDGKEESFIVGSLLASVTEVTDVERALFGTRDTSTVDFFTAYRVRGAGRAALAVAIDMLHDAGTDFELNQFTEQGMAVGDEFVQAGLTRVVRSFGGPNNEGLYWGKMIANR